METPVHLHVLVIDDDEEDSALTRRALAEIPWFTCTVDCADTYGKALAAIRAHDYDVILLDHGLGARSGLELLEEAFGDSLPVAVVLLTGMASHQVDEAASRAGIAHLLEKSELRAGPLERSVRYALERTRIERELRANVTERLRVEEQLRESASRYRLMFNSNPSPLWVTDDETSRVLSVNDAALELYGYTREEFLRLTVEDLRVPLEWPELRPIASTGPTGMVRIGNVQHRKKNGDVFEVDKARHSIELNGRGCHLVLATDITDRRSAERAQATALANADRLTETLEFERNRLTLIFAQAPAFMAVMRGAAHVFEMANEACVALLDRNPIGLPLLEAVPEWVEQGLVALVDQAFANDRPFAASHVPAFVRDADGRVRHHVVNFVLQPLEESDGSVSGVLIHGVDVTEHARSAEALSQSEAQYRSLVELSPDGILVHQKGEVVFANRSAARILNAASPAELIGLDVMKLVHPDTVDVVHSRMALLADGHPVDTFDTRWMAVDGTVRNVDVASISFAFRGQPAVHTVFRDTTGQRHLEEQLRQAQKMEAVGQLAGGVAHDFNNLLTVIKANVEFLLEDLGPGDPHREEVSEVGEAADRAAELTRQLLAFSRKQLLLTRVLDCNAIVLGVKPMLARLIREDVTVEFRLAEHPGWILADGGQLEQVVLNLAVNARDAMPGGGRLLITTEETILTADSVMEDHSIVVPGRYVSIGVSDTGTGIAPEARAHIFEPFFTTKPVGSGTGLGLATVYGIVKQFKGYLQVDSVVGRGTTFCVMLPMATSALDIAEPASVARDTSGTETVLLVEDMDALRAIARRILDRSGYTVLEARNGREALAVARAHAAPIHLLLTDIVMPAMNGLRLAEQLQRARPDVAVLFMSGYAEDDNARRGVEEARAGFIHKPFSPGQLLLAVREALEL